MQFHIIDGPDAQNLMDLLHLLIFIAVVEKGEKKMGMRDYEDMKHIAIPKEQEEMMNVICDAWDECRSLETCKQQDLWKGCYKNL